MSSFVVQGVRTHVVATAARKSHTSISSRMIIKNFRSRMSYVFHVLVLEGKIQDRSLCSFLTSLWGSVAGQRSANGWHRWWSEFFTVSGKGIISRTSRCLHEDRLSFEQDHPEILLHVHTSCRTRSSFGCTTHIACALCTVQVHFPSVGHTTFGWRSCWKGVWWFCACHNYPHLACLSDASPVSAYSISVIPPWSTWLVCSLWHLLGARRQGWVRVWPLGQKCPPHRLWAQRVRLDDQCR